MKTYIFTLTLLFVGALTAPATAAAQSGTLDLNGYAWSSTMGWISMSCDQSELSANPSDPINTNTCASAGGHDYGVSIDTATGNLNGYAWSSNAGWIDFSPTGPFPSAIDTANAPAAISGTLPDVTLTGWARVCAGAANAASCSGALGSNAGGWDGWISLSGESSDGSTYSVSFTDGVADDNANSFAWGGPNTMGWIDFSPETGVTSDDPGVKIPPAVDILVNGVNVQPGTVTAGGVYPFIDFDIDVTGIPDGETVAYTLSLGGVSTVTGNVTGNDPGVPTFSPAVRLTNVPFTIGNQLYVEIDMPEPGDVNEIDDENVLTQTYNLAFPEPTMTIEGPDALPTGESGEISWTLEAPYAITCYVNGPGINNVAVQVNGTIGASDYVEGDQSSSVLQNAARFEFTCDVNGTIYTQTHTVEVIPTFQEI